MRATLVTTLAAAAGLFACISAPSAMAAGTADFTRIPGLQQAVPPLTESIAYRIHRKYWRGCYRWRFCNDRYYDGYRYRYRDCYWGPCLGGYGGGGYVQPY